MVTKKIVKRFVFKEHDSDAFECDICKTHFYTPEQAEKCEKNHSCEHKNIRYYFSDDSLDFSSNNKANNLIVERCCEECNRFLEPINIRVDELIKKGII